MFKMLSCRKSFFPFSTFACPLPTPFVRSLICLCRLGIVLSISTMLICSSLPIGTSGCVFSNPPYEYSSPVFDQEQCRKLLIGGSLYHFRLRKLRTSTGMARVFELRPPTMNTSSL